MNLLGAKLYDPAAAVSKATSALLAMTAFDTVNLRLTITVPPHGMVLFKGLVTLTGATTYPVVLLGVLSGSTVIVRVTPTDFPGTANAASQAVPCRFEAIATGLTPGSASFDLAYGVEVLLASTAFKYGGPNDTTTNNAWGAAQFEAWDPQPIPTAAPGAVGGLLTAPTTANVGTSDVTRWNGTAVASPATAGVPEVNVKNINNVSASPVTTVKAVQGLTNADTISAYTGNTPQTGDSFARIGAAGAGLTSLGDARVANLDAAVSSRSTYAGGAVASVTAAVTVGTNNDKTGYSLSTAAIQAIWDALTSALTTVGSIGKLLVTNIDAAISSRVAGSSYTAPPTVTAIRAEMDANSTRLANLDATVSSRMAASSYTAPDNADILLIKAKTDNLPASPAAAGDIPTANQNADALLTRDWTLITGEASRSVLNALRFIRNRFSTTAAPGVVTIYKEDDTSVAYTKAVTTNAAADPIVEG